ncbi:nitroreductase family protein, partial [Nocardioides sp. CER28]
PWKDLQREFQLDAERYHRYAIPRGGNERFDSMSGMQLDAAATRLSHRLEKGFALPDTRRPFGVRAAPALTRAMANLDAGDALFATEAKEVLEALQRWNDHGVRDDRISPRGDALPGNPLDPETLATFLTSRHSVRDFDQRPVDRALLEEAVRLAAYAPSVCNRQGYRAYLFDDRADIARILSMHAGSRGFSARVPALFVVTFDIRAFENSLERNQGWIDGGLFSMMLLLSLHGLGLGAVPLNWSRRNGATARLRRVAALPDHDNVVMLIAAGHPAEGYRVARSTRRPLGQILRIGMPSD